MSTSSVTPFQNTLRWLSTHTGFPASRLPDKGELLVLIATAAAQEELDARKPAVNGQIQFNANYAAQMRNYTAQRRKTHIICDNSAKT
ncbi:hypothetical protein [Oleiharenicola lentus]|uniref:hypothetical protein n=1 Tax=Oleiharenicola lentus TaxID=2508720 RepID=UPI003F662230